MHEPVNHIAGNHQPWWSWMFLYIRSLSVIFLLSVAGLFITASPAFAGTYSNIENMGGWSTCSTCAGPNGSGPNVPHSVNYWVSSPSLDGSSAQFSISGSTSFADAIWWKELGGNDGVSHFTYDLYFYIKNPAASEALEFDMNQTAGGRHYTFGTQCGINYDKEWDVWDTADGGWRKTGIGCSVKAYAWNHLTWQFYRANGQIHFVSVTLNGVTHYVNRTYGSRARSGSEINNAFQMDETGSHTAYSVWLDKVTVKGW
jgi:hypothetical protein